MSNNTERAFFQKLDLFLHNDIRARQGWMLSGIVTFLAVFFLLSSADTTEEAALGFATLACTVLMIAYPCVRCLDPGWWRSTPPAPHTGVRALAQALVVDRRFALVKAPIFAVGLLLAVFGRRLEGVAIREGVRKARSIKEPQQRLTAMRNIVDAASETNATIPSDSLSVVKDEAKKARETRELAPFANDLDTSLYSYGEIQKPSHPPPTPASSINQKPKLVRNAKTPEPDIRVHLYGPYEIVEYGPPIVEPEEILITMELAGIVAGKAVLFIPGESPIVSRGMMIFPGPGKPTPREEIVLDGWGLFGVMFEGCRLRYEGGRLTAIKAIITPNNILLGAGIPDLMDDLNFRGSRFQTVKRFIRE